ncbi:hypothetical protein U9M48_032779 [Paspalum notatum var. saurae]|uniref:Reverse transcriptase Ty1/copia-type domain-containing protein n=1 Tax=Paspalum notatum var. saurae TaxID=547442 RepID=A0AAQ3U5W3_PASNO
MRGLRTSSLRKGSRLAELTPLFSPRRRIMISLFVKCTLMILSDGDQGVPDLPSGGDKSIGRRETLMIRLLDRHDQDPCNRNTTRPLVINQYCKDFGKMMAKEFEMSMIGELTFFLGFQIKQLKERTFNYQEKYTRDLHKRFKMDDFKPIDTPMSTNTVLDVDESGIKVDQTLYRSMIGSLLYLCASRLDIMFSVCLCARFQADPKESHLTAVKRILRYLKHTPSIGLWYPKGASFELLGYSDSDFAGCRVERKSTSGGCYLLGRLLVSWSSKKQNCVSSSTAEAEYIAAGSCCAQLIYMKQTLLDYGVNLSRVPLLCDNESAVKLANNPIQHSRTKHIDIRHHFIRDHVAKGDILL